MRLLIVVLTTICTIQLFAQHRYLSSTKTYTTKDGLSSDRILSIHKDARGFMWIGTEDGLNRYDGQEFKIYSKQTHPEMTINVIHRIVEDDEGWLWLLKANELYEQHYQSPEIVLLNIYTNEFTTLEKRFGTILPFDSEGIVFIKKLEDQSIMLWSAKAQKGFFYTSKSGFQSFNLPKNIAQLNDATLQDDGNILIETSVFKGSLIERNIHKIDRKGNVLGSRSTDLVIELKKDSESQLVKFEGNYYLVGGWNADAYNVFDENLTNSDFHESDDIELIDFSIWNEQQNLLWMKNGQKIRAINKDGIVIFEQEDKLDFLDIPIFFDGNTTWLSNKREGLVAVKLEPNYFQTHRLFELDFDNSTRGIFAYDEGLLITSTIAGVRQMKPNGEISKFPISNENFFTNFLEDREGNLWGIEFQKLVRYSIESKKKTVFDHEFLLQSWSLFEDKKGNIWAHGQGNKLYSLNPKTGEFTDKTTLPNENLYVYFFTEKDAESFWICTNKGLFTIHLDGRILEEYNSKQTDKNYLPADDFHHLYKDENGIIWLATGDAGLISWQSTVDNQQSVYQQFTTQDGLSSNALHAIYEDEDDYLWMSSEHGLMQFDKRTEKVITYYKENGIPHNEFNRIAHFRQSDGQLYFGGINGMVTFHPKNFSQVRNQNKTFPLAISEFKQFSGDEGRFEDLTTQLIESQKIKLNPNDRFFNLKLALLDFEHGHPPTFSYRIEGLYDWQITNNSDLGISGLPYGNHILEIKAQNANQQLAMNELSIPIQVLRPFYLTGWFMIFVLGMIGSGIFYFIKRRTRQMLIVQEAEQLRNLDKMKSQFFANISHELRTPITLILGPLSQFIKNNPLSDIQKQQLAQIQNNGKNILNLVNEVLDLSKLEAGKLTLNLSPTKIPQFIERVVANFESAAATKNIEFQFMSFLQKDIVAEFDKNKLEKILNNLLSNALKFTPKDGIIQIMVAQIEQDLVINIKDSGRGIPTEDLPFIFERYFQSNQKMEGGTGIGLALTKELTELMEGKIFVNSVFGEGSEFEVRLPIQMTIGSWQSATEQMSNFSEKSKVNFQISQKIESQNRETILLVEDNLSLQNFIKSVLEHHYNVITTNNGVEALSRLPTADCHLILSDVMMPEMDGFTLLKKVKSDDRFCSIPFILLTARADMEDKLKGLRIGVDDYMTKPFEVEELLLRIKKLIQNSKNRTLEIESTNQSIESSVPSIVHRPSSTVNIEWLEKIEAIAKREINNKNFKMENLARELLISQRNMSRKIKLITGLSPNRYIRTIRLQIARQILETQDIYTLKEVSYAVGFENVTYFSQQFEAQFGKSPTEFLKKMELA